MINSKPNSAVVERMGYDSVVLFATSRRSVYARQLCSVASGNFRNILSRARVSQLASWLCLDDGDRNIASLAVVIKSDTRPNYWQLLLKKQELATKVRLLSPGANLSFLISPEHTLLLGILLIEEDKGMGGWGDKGTSFPLFPCLLVSLSSSLTFRLNTPLSKEFQGENR